MTVRELITQLEKLPQELQVLKVGQSEGEAAFGYAVGIWNPEVQKCSDADFQGGINYVVDDPVGEDMVVL